MAKTAREVKAEMALKGLALSEWARLHGFKPRTVYAVVYGQRKALRGIGHDIAVALGMKEGKPRSATITAPRRKAAAHTRSLRGRR